MKFLIDANLNHRISLWNNADYTSVAEMDKAMPDNDIWDYAIIHEMTIITKDADFRQRLLLSDPPPRVIHVRVGNMNLKSLRMHLYKVWDEVLELITTCKIVTILPDRIEGIVG